MKRVVTFGEVLMRLSPNGQERLFQTPTLRTFFGGSEANTAASLAHFGARVEHVTRVPANPIGDAALAALRAEGVGVRACARGGARLGLYFVEGGADLRPIRVVYDRAGSAFAEIEPEHVHWDALLRGAEWFHVSGITPALGEGPLRSVHAALDTARAAGVPVSLDLNYRPALWVNRDPRPVLQPIARRAQLLIANPGAIEKMLGITTEGTAPERPDALRATAEAVHAEFGCRRVAITQRETLSASEHGWQAFLWDAEEGTLHHGGRYQVKLVDRVGGGDSFAAGLLHALLDDRDAADAVRFATAASALKLTIPGDFNRVTADEVERLISSHR
ncbi:MAG: PfkB family carbohydrate kinase [Gemmatirosa sp.]